MGIKEKLRQGRTIFGTFVKINAPSLMEILGGAGFDFAVIDCEHSTLTFADVENLVRAGENAGLDSVVRLPAPREEHVLHALDTGAAGIQVPGLHGIEDIRELIKAAKYYPEGERGLSFTHRAARYGLADRDTYLKNSNQDNLVVIHIENQAAIDDLEHICDLPQVDVIFIGPVDLSQSLGKPLNTNDELVQKAIAGIFATGARKHKPVGIFAATPDDIARYREMGAKYICCSTDVGIFIKGVREITRLFQT